MSIYQGNWSPRGARKAWEKTSISAQSARDAISAVFPVGEVVDACGWFDEADALRILVADTETERVTYRRGNGQFTITSEPRP